MHNQIHLFYREIQALITEYPFAQYLASEQNSCSLKVIPMTIGKSSWCPAFRKNSPWNKIISKKILEYKEKGFFENTEKRWMLSVCTSKDTINNKSYKYRIENFSGLIVIFACSLMVSVLALLVERSISNRRKQFSRYSF